MQAESPTPPSDVTPSILMRFKAVSVVDTFVSTRVTHVETPEAAAALFRHVLPVKSRERLGALLLGHGDKVLGYTLAEGPWRTWTLARVLRDALGVDFAEVIICQYDPRRVPSPFLEGEPATAEWCGDVLGITVRDFLVIGPDDHESLIEAKRK